MIQSQGFKSVLGIVGMVLSAALLLIGSPAQAAPTSAVSITAPIGGATISGPISIIAQVNSSVSWVNFYIDNAWIASSPPYTQTWNTTTVANGLHKIAINAYNSSKVLIASSTITVNVLNGVP